MVERRFERYDGLVKKKFDWLREMKIYMGRRGMARKGFYEGKPRDGRVHFKEWLDVKGPHTSAVLVIKRNHR